jgi:hypothetical protein
MDFKSLISQLDQLNEAEGKTVHKGTYGTSHGKEDVRDQYGHKIGKVNKDAETDKEAPKKGRGRPKKGADETGEVKKYDFSAFGVTKGKDVKLPKHDKKKTKKHSIKEYLDQMYTPLNEGGYTTSPMQGAVEVKDGAGKVVATAKNPAAAAAFQKGDITLPDKMNEADKQDAMEDRKERLAKEIFDLTMLIDTSDRIYHHNDPQDNALLAKLKAEFARLHPGEDAFKIGSAVKDREYQQKRKQWDQDDKDAARSTGIMQKAKNTLGSMYEGDIGKHNNGKTGFDALVRKLTPKYGKEAATKIAGKQAQKIKEADMPPRDALASPLTMEAKKSKPDSNKNGIPDYAEDGKGKNDLKKKKVKEDMDSESNTDKKKCPPMSHIKKMCQDGKSVAEICKMHPDCDQKELKQMVADCKKKMVKEGMDQKLNAARSEGKAHGLRGHSHCGKNYEDMEEARCYHEGYKEGLDECYGQVPIQGYVGESTSHAADADEVLTRWVSSLNPMSSHRIDKELQILGANDSRTGGPELYNAIKQAVMTNPKWKNSEIGKYVSNKMLDETTVVGNMASYGAEEGELAEADIEESPFTWAAKNTDKGDKFSVGGKEFVKNDAFAFEALDKQLNALLEDKEVTEGMTVSISKGQQGAPDSVSVSAQDAEADELLSVIKSAGLGLFGGDDSPGMSHTEPMTVDNGGEPAEIGAGGDAIEVVGDHDGMMNLMKKLSGIGGGEQSHDEETCESCGGMMEAGHSCSKDTEMVDEVESEDQMTLQMAEDNPPDSGAAEVDAEDASVSAANAAAAAYNPSQDIDEGGDGGEASDVGNIGVEAGDADEEMQASMNEVEKIIPDPKYDHEPPAQESDPTPDDQGDDPIPDDDPEGEQKERMSESSFFSLYKKLAMLSEESTSEKDDKAEKAAKKVAKDIEYDEGHKGKDDDKAEKAGKEVKKDIEYDDKKDKKKIDEWANDAGKNGTDTSFETDIDFMMNVISGGLNKRKATGQTTIPVVASQLGRQISRNTTGINESVDSSDAVAQWKKLAGLK